MLAEVSLEKPSNRTDLAVKKDDNLFIGIAQISLYLPSGVQLLSQLFLKRLFLCRLLIFPNTWSLV